VQLEVVYDPTTTCPNIMKFLREVLYEEDIPAIQELLGYLLWRDYPAAKAWMLVGTGGNGKSTFIALVKALLGLENVSSRGLVDLERNRFATAELYGKLANLYADLEDVALKTTGRFKMLTGRDPVTAEFKYRIGFPFVNYAKLIFSCNKIPEAVDDTDAFFRRWIIISFPNQFLGHREDRNLLAKLTTPEELSGLLNFALEGLKRLQTNGWHFSNAKTTDDVRLEYIRKSSPVKAFLMDCCKPDMEGLVPKSELFSKFSEYCHLHKLPVLSSDAFFKKLPEVNPNLGRLYGVIPNGPVRIDGKPKRVHCIKGLILLPKEEWGNGERDEGDEGENNSEESPAHVAHPAPAGILDGHLTPADPQSVQRVQGVQGPGHCNVTEPELLGTQEGREAALGYLNTWCKELDLNLCAQELVSAGYTRSLAMAASFVKELAEHSLLGDWQP
jgi:P4 family phage/plasmid primase-like protien